tara:strand:+ start:2093 stop:2776 length:684 start_codon:yes stop_codon:yes gene_type:complete
MITVLIPTYNRKKYIKDCLASLFNQTYRQFKILIYDDGSTDSTIDEINSLMHGSSIPIALVSNSVNCGVSHARNQLLAYCDTEYACFCDSDDLSHYQRLEYQFARLSEDPDKIVFTKCVPFGNNKIVNTQESPFRHKNAKSFPMPSAMFKTKNAIMFNEQVRWGAEDGLWKKEMIKLFEPVYLPQVLYYVRFHPERISMQKRERKNRTARLKSQEIIHKELKRINDL